MGKLLFFFGGSSVIEKISFPMNIAMLGGIPHFWTNQTYNIVGETYPINIPIKCLMFSPSVGIYGYIPPIISSISLIRSLISHINVRLYIYNYMLYRIFLVTPRRVLVQHCLDSIWPMRNGQAAQSLAPQARLRLSHAVGSPSGIFATLQG